MVQSLGRCPFDDASGRELLAWLAQAGILPVVSRGTVVANGTSGVTVSDTNWHPTSEVNFSLKTAGGTPASVYIDSGVDGVSFTIKSAASNTSTYNYTITNPA